MTTTCRNNVVRVRKGMLPVKYLSYNKVSFLCQSNIMEIIRLTKMRKIWPTPVLGILPILK